MHWPKLTQIGLSSLTQVFSETLRENLFVFVNSKPFIIAQVKVAAVAHSSLWDDSSQLYLLVRAQVIVRLVCLELIMSSWAMVESQPSWTLNLRVRLEKRLHKDNQLNQVNLEVIHLISIQRRKIVDLQPSPLRTLQYCLEGFWYLLYLCGIQLAWKSVCLLKIASETCETAIGRWL